MHRELGVGLQTFLGHVSKAKERVLAREDIAPTLWLLSEGHWRT